MAKKCQWYTLKGDAKTQQVLSAKGKFSFHLLDTGGYSYGSWYPLYVALHYAKILKTNGVKTFIISISNLLSVLRSCLLISKWKKGM